MKNRRLRERLLSALTALLFVALLVLLTALFLAYRQSSVDTVPFDLGEITADKTVDATDISDCFLPAFLGVTIGGERSALIGGERTMAELYAMLSPALSEALDSGDVRGGTEADWERLLATDHAVYIRYHTEMPAAVVALFADLARGVTPSRSGLDFYLSEAVLIPYVNGENAAASAFRQADGSVKLITVSMPREILSTQDLEQFVRAYEMYLVSFNFIKTNGTVAAVCTDPVTSRGIFMANNTAGILRENFEEVSRMLGVFGLNPDKLLSFHEEEDGSQSYIGTQGAFDVHASSFAYRSSSEGGIGLSDLAGYAADSGIAEYIRACLILAGEVKAVNRHYAGGDAKLLLGGVWADGGTVSLTFYYVFDNIRIADIPPALTATFENGVLREASLYTLTAQSTGRRVGTYSEEWFLGWLTSKTGERAAGDRISLVYRADYVSDQVPAEWRAEERRG
ncbi:MAG: hypothetical protein K6A33_02870 [Clostridiales bacterium]|nr:hypothetical protein [Clostridiales bacterium]